MSKKYNLEFIGEIVSSPNGMSSWFGTTVTFWGKFQQYAGQKPYEKFTRKNLIEAVPITEEKPSMEYHRCTAFSIVPEKYLFIND